MSPRERRLHWSDDPIPEDPDSPYRMADDEISTGLVVGIDRRQEPLRATRTDTAALTEALEHALLPSLRRPPCLVSFSGGRDSAGILAVATRAARRHGLPLPIPATNRFPRMKGVDEDAWQELTIAHLGLEDWVRVDVTGELDIVGPVAGPLLKKFGVLWPPNHHFLGLLAPQASEGSLLTGVGGDELLEPSTPRGLRILAGQQRPHRGDLRELAAAVAPRRQAARRLRSRLTAPEWLSPAARREWIATVAREMTGQQRRWGQSVCDYWWRSRARRGLVQSIGAVTGHRVHVAHPYMDGAFLSAVAGARRWTSFPSREHAMDVLFGELLPRSVIERRDKAVYFQPFVGPHARSFMSSWDGTGVDERIVDADALRRVWARPDVDARSYCLLQALWLAAERHKG